MSSYDFLSIKYNIWKRACFVLCKLKVKLYFAFHVSYCLVLMMRYQLPEGTVILIFKSHNH